MVLPWAGSCSFQFAYEGSPCGSDRDLTEAVIYHSRVFPLDFLPEEKLDGEFWPTCPRGHTKLSEGVTRVSETAQKDISLGARLFYQHAWPSQSCPRLVPVQEGASWFPEGSKIFSFLHVSSEVG